MPDPFQHVSHRAHSRGGASGPMEMRDRMMSEAANLKREIREARRDASGRGEEPRSGAGSWWRRLLRRTPAQAPSKEAAGLHE